MNDEMTVTTVKNDPVHAPLHYRGDGEVECKRSMRSMLTPVDLSRFRNDMSYWWSCAFKYLWRWPLKHFGDGKLMLQDLEKCKECIDNIIEGLKVYYDTEN